MSDVNRCETLGVLLQNFFTQYLQAQRQVSQCTIAAYRDTFRLLLVFAEQSLHRPPAKLTLHDLDRALVLSFLSHLEQVRQNSVRTRNSRLTAIRSFMHYVSLQEPSLLATCSQVLAIPVKKFERPLIGYLTREQIEAILNAPNGSTWSGHRDRVMFATMYNTGARVSEVINMRGADLSAPPEVSLRIHGKGRKLRTVPLWNDTAAQLRRWISVASIGAADPLFPNRTGAYLTRAGASHRLAEAAAVAANTCQSLVGVKPTPHLIRHSTAMHLLQSGVDITVIALWLGHESPVTTHGYIEADLEMKERALHALDSPNQPQGRFEADDQLMKFLEQL